MADEQEVQQEQEQHTEEAGSRGGADETFTVYVGNLHQVATEHELGGLFTSLAPMMAPVNIKIMRDKASGMSAGYGFVTFADRAGAEHAMEAMNGQVAWGRPLKLQWAQHRNTGGAQPSSSAEGQSFDVFVGDLARDIDEQKLREAFSHLGNVTRVVVMWDYPSGRNKGYGFVSFATQEEAEAAIQQMHGAMVGSRPVRCGWGQRRAQQGGAGAFHSHQQHQHQHQHQQQQGFFPARGNGSLGRGQQWGDGGQQHAPGFGSAVAMASHLQQQQQQGYPQQGYPQHLNSMMGLMGMQLGLDPQQAQQLAQQQAQRAQLGGAFQPATAATANGFSERPGGAGGRPGARGGGGGGGKVNAGQAGRGAGPEPTKAGAADAQQHVPSSSVSLPALAEGGQGPSPRGSAAAGGSCCVRVDNVDKTVQKAELFGAFAKFGTLEDCTIVRKGNPYHAIVRFATPQQAAEAAAGMNGFQLDGRRLRCAVEGSSASGEGAGALPRAKSASDIPLPPRALDRAHAVEALAAKMRAVLQDRGELHGTSPQARAAAGAAGAAAAGGGTPTAAHGAAAGAFSGRPPGVSPGQSGPAHYPQHHQWVPPGHMQGGEASPRGASAAGAGRGGPGHGPGGPRYPPAPPPSWTPQQAQHMLSPGMLMAQQAQQQARAHAGHAAGGAGASPLMPPQQQPMSPMAYGPGGVVLPPQLAMLNMMAAQGVPGGPPTYTLPMMPGYGGQPMVGAPPVMQPGFAALQQQALIQQLLLHQQRQQQAAAAAAAAAAAEAAGAAAAAQAGETPGVPDSGTSQAESIPSGSGTPPPTSSTPPPPAQAAPEPVAAGADS
ncbi:hypothetical protein N2152v2_005093 [Parachlorella kessleri]